MSPLLIGVDVSCICCVNHRTKYSYKNFLDLGTTINVDCIVHSTYIWFVAAMII